MHANRKLERTIEDDRESTVTGRGSVVLEHSPVLVLPLRLSLSALEMGTVPALKECTPR